MNISLPLEQMSIEEKLQVMETIWDDLSRRAESLAPPPWHGKVLEAIEAAVERGEESFDDWEVAKKRLRDTLE